MRHIRKAAALLLVLALAIGFGGCAQNMTPAQKIVQAQINLSKVKSMTATMDMKMDFSIVQQQIAMAIQYDMTVFSDPTRVKADMMMDGGTLLGQQEATLYMEQQDGKAITYTLLADKWTRTEEAIGAEGSKADTFDLQSAFKLYSQCAESFKETGEEQIGGRAAIRLEGALTGEALEEAVTASGVLNSISEGGNIGKEDVATLYQAISDLPITIWLDKEKLLPVRYEMDMTDIMTGIMENAMSGSPEMAAYMDFKANTCSVVVELGDFDSAPDFDIPAEAKETQV
ncbi:hypothetical protein H8699_06680 [Christensenellaceae bacterium NSJ-44]|uniref:LppX_LprAFG lipoprotein n=1 Tax=Luoshenia tenuis TaxID=2763654 RepID=A0A926D188_9FIRM|nr:DUF6612 family protein [Luoshenia tenuis]MBC8529109.1 hypothetical protein [Luoshenia tenuis]